MRLGLRWLERRYLAQAEDTEVAILRLFGEDADADQLEAEHALAEAVAGGDVLPEGMIG
jgi:hypothetical protein